MKSLYASCFTKIYFNIFLLSATLPDFLNKVLYTFLISQMDAGALAVSLPPFNPYNNKNNNFEYQNYEAPK
jgi:hypothetical protein